MTAMIKLLRENAEEPLQAVCGWDIICEGCPNLMKDGSCSNSAPAKKEKEKRLPEGMRCGVDEKDAALARELKITPGQIYTYRELTEIAKWRLTKEIFDSSCSNCQWYQQGLCSFEKWRASSFGFMVF